MNFVCFHPSTGSVAAAAFRWVLKTTPQPNLYGDAVKSKAIIESWVRQIEADAFTPAADVLRNTNPAFENRSIPGTSDTPQVPALAERGANRLQASYARLDKQLASAPFVAGNSFSVADITAMCAIDFAEYVGVVVPGDLKDLADWRSRVSARPSASA